MTLVKISKFQYNLKILCLENINKKDLNPQTKIILKKLNNKTCNNFFSNFIDKINIYIILKIANKMSNKTIKINKIFKIIHNHNNKSKNNNKII